MRVQDVMTTDVETVRPAADAGAAWERMRAGGFHHLVVTDVDGVVGVLSDRDAGSRRGAALRAGRTVADLMSPHVVTVEPTATVRRAANLMRGRSIGCLVVTRGTRIAGIVTVADLLELLGRGGIRPNPSGMRGDARHRAPHRKRHVDAGTW